MLSFKTLFRVQGAAVLLGVTLLGGSHAVGQNVINSNTTIRNSLCIGSDCANSESYGFDTLRLKENNTRIMFIDTSSTGSFPRRDWQLVANASANGGLNYFGIHDCGNNNNGGASACGTRVFVVEGGAPANSIFVDSGGRVGFKTSTPVVDLHTRSGNTPTLRLEQDGSSGFAPQTWDVAGNETNFFIRDVTGGSRLSLRIRPGAPSSSIDIAANGAVGIGTGSPQDRLHVVGNGNPAIRIETTGASGGKWSVGTVDAAGHFFVRDAVAGSVPFRILSGAPNLSLEVRNNGAIRMSTLTNCSGIQTDANGILSCTAGPTPPRGATSATTMPALVRHTNANVSGSTRSASLTWQGSPGATGGSSGGTTESPSNTCAPGDMAGSWSLVGTNIEKFGANSVLWCDVQLTQAQSRSKNSYSISGACRNHVPSASAPEKFTVDGKGSITETATCRMSGSFRIKQGSTVVTTAHILEGRIDGPSGKKTRAVALSRMPLGRTSAIQTFVLQR